MCSACASSSPSAVNSAHEQSARSLMFGLYAARRSTGAHLVGHARKARDPHLQRRRIHHRSSLRRTIQAPSSRGSARQPAGTHTVQSGSATTAGPTTAAPIDIGKVSDTQRRRDRRSGPHRDHLDGRAAAYVAVAAFVLGGEVVRRRDRELVALADVATVDRGLDHRACADPIAGFALDPCQRVGERSAGEALHDLARPAARTTVRPPNTRPRAAG